MRAAPRLTILTLVACALLCAAPAQAAVLQTYTTPGTYSWQVPAGVTSITVSLWGAQGGNGYIGSSYQSKGGKGGLTRYTLAVSPGTTYQFNVGGAGATYGASTVGGGGFNGGGNVAAQNPGAERGGGGGATDMRAGAFALADRIGVAGGGGGAGGGTGGHPDRETDGGAGGGTTGATGRSNINFGAPTVGGGAGGTPSAGGAGGTNSGTTGINGAAGSSGGGGQGGAPASFTHQGGGGGGGGGYYGGGGGAGGYHPSTIWVGGAGGGGGSSYVPPAGTSTSLVQGVQSGNGAVTIADGPPSNPTGVTVPASPSNNAAPVITGNSPSAGTTVSIYTTSDCLGTPIGTGTKAAFASPGIAATVPLNATTTIYVQATDSGGTPSACVSAGTYTHDNIAPTKPFLWAFNPNSPTNATSAMAETYSIPAVASDTIRLYTTGDCTGTPIASGPGGAPTNIPFSPVRNTSVLMSVDVTDPAGNVSPCSDAKSYVQDDIVPNAPIDLALSPVAGNDNNPELIGDVDESNLRIDIYESSDCSGPVAFTGHSTELEGAGISLGVSDNTTTTWSALAVDPSSNVSACSSPVTYTEDSFTAAPSGLAFVPASPANDNAPKVKGAAEDGATVKVTRQSDCGATVVATATAAELGGAGIELNVADDTSSDFWVQATDPYGNVSACSAAGSYVEDSTPPAEPGLAITPIGPANENSPVLTGSSDPGTDVRIYTANNCAGPVATTVTAGDLATGVTMPVADDTTSSFSVRALDAAGNASTCSDGVGYTEDSTAPDLPTDLAFVPARANDNAPSLTGTVEANADVDVYASGDCSGGAVASGDSDDLADGIGVSVTDDSVTDFTVKLTDTAGNASACSDVAAFREDSSSPTPSGLAWSPASPSNDNTPKLSGTVEPGSAVGIYGSSDCSTDLIASRTEVEFAAGVALTFASDSTTTVYVQATDDLGNVSPCSAGTTYVEDSTPTSEPWALTFIPSSPANDNAPKIKGETEFGVATVRVYPSDNCTGTPVVGSDFDFTVLGAGIPLSVADDTTTKFTAKAVDAAGNASVCSEVATYVEDSSSPKPSNMAFSPRAVANENAPLLIGVAEPGSTVRVHTLADCSDGAAATGSALDFGNTGIALSVVDNSVTTFYAQATDALGNVSPCSDAITYTEDSIAPATPSGVVFAPASPANDNQPLVKGSADADSTVDVYESGNCTGGSAQGSAAQFGGAGIQVGVPNDSTTAFSVRATDAAGNASGCVGPLTYVEDSTSLAPTDIALAPAGPANNNDPVISGTAEAGSSVAVYTTPDCSGPPTESASAGSFASPGILLGVLDDTTTTFRVKVTDAVGNVSPCSSGVTYVEDSSSPKPVARVASGGGAANDNMPRFGGTAEPGSTVRLFVASDCSGTPVVSGSAAAYDSPGLAVTVADDSTTTLYARATDALGNVSPCGDAVTYVEDSTAPSITLETPTVTDGQPVLRGVAGTAARDGDAVTVTISGPGGAAVATLDTTRGADGAFSVQPAAALAPGAYTATASQSDTAGNKGESGAVSFTVPKLAEPPPPPPPPGTGPGTTTPPPVEKPSTLSFKLASKKLERGKVKLTLKCTGTATCRGTIHLRPAKGAGTGAKVRYTIAGGKTKVVRLALPETTTAQLKKNRKLRKLNLRVVVTPSGGKAVTKPISVGR